LDITPFIKELIVLNECVILRGVGGFETTYKHATLDKERKLIVPPSKRINFRSDLIRDNGVLENYLSENLEISKSKASELIDNYVQGFFKTIQEKGKVFLDEIGEFSLDEKHNIVFSEIEEENFLADSFGLDSIHFENDIKPKDKSVSIELQPVITQKRKLTGWYVAIGVLLLLISITTLILISTSKGIHVIPWSADKPADDLQDNVVFGNNEKALEDSIIKSIEKSLNERTIPKKALAVPQPVTMNASASGQNYYLVAGSFKNRKNADYLEDQLIRKGFDPEIMVTGENFYRVVVGAFTDRKEAISELRRIRVQIDQSVWLLEQNGIN